MEPMTAIRTVRASVFLVLVAFLAAETVESADLAAVEAPMADAELLLQISAGQADATPGLNVAQCWRMKSLIRSNGLRDGFEWAVPSLKFFEEDDCSGTPLGGEAISSGFQQPDEAAGRDGKAENAFDGNMTTAWVAKRRDSGEYVGLKLAAAKEVKCIKIKQEDQEHGVRAAVLEKSTDCVGWARVAEFPDFPLSYTQEETFLFEPLDEMPNGVFQIRSRHDVGRCIGATVPDEEVEDVDYGIAQRNFVDGAPLLLQRCDLNTLPQFWYVDDEYKLVNVRDTSSVLTVPDAEATGDPPVAMNPQEGGSVIIRRCENGCPNLNSYVKYSENEDNDGFFIMRNNADFILSPENDSLDKGTPIVTTACGTASAGGELAECPGKTNAQFDLVPLFTVMPGKKAVNCAPYSHSHPDDLQPMNLPNAWEAQRRCAADKTCMVYMYVDSDAADAPADERGKAWFCTALDVVYSGKQGYQLGFRAMNLNREEKEKQEVTYDMETGKVEYE